MPEVYCTAATCKYFKDNCCQSATIKLINKEFDNGEDEQVCTTYKWNEEYFDNL